MTSRIYCSLCGKENYVLQRYCCNCGNILKTYRIESKNTCSSLEYLITEKNKNKILNTEITDEIYTKIITNIRDMGLMNLNFTSDDTTFDKIVKMTRQFSKLHNEKQWGTYGYYHFNNIIIDNNYNEAMKICTLIHELSHHLYSEIFEQLLMYIFDSRKTDAIEAIVQYTVIENPYYAIGNEYLAYTTEGYFMNNAMKDYASILNILNKHQLDMNRVGNMYIIGNAVAYDVIKILEGIIDVNLKKELSYMCKKYNLMPSRDNRELDNVPLIKDNVEKGKRLKSMLVDIFNFFLHNDYNDELLFNLMQGFKMANQ
ncbi:hypothetical protein [Methanosphaera sp. WGK6]|uniref:hypothetical protein n=1 Tax=Methanosphaera sp. WGK6 TaxID=1561964 RepID=UPI00084C2F2B|nr:hypothetical protein [Methanosphaera sp. WGK6]OED30356.1 hypothetical protein NL43_02985 [Methanosphaera sp. WGK6]